MGTPGYVQLAKWQISGYEQKGFNIPLNQEERENMFQTLARFDATKHMKQYREQTHPFLARRKRPSSSF